MTQRKGLVLDANILLRAVFGQRVRELLEAFEDAMTFYSPDVCFDDARKYIPDVSSRRRIDPLPGLAVLEQVSKIVESVDQSLYEDFETVARERVTPRDPDGSHGFHGGWHGSGSSAWDTRRELRSWNRCVEHQQGADKLQQHVK
jgi:predicted nucleic acid-binding protein